MINTGENRKVLHQLSRGQAGKDVLFQGKNLRDFYAGEQKKIADFAASVHSGKIVGSKGDRFASVVQIGIGGSDLGPRAMYLALEQWAQASGKKKMEARFISNVDPDDAVAVASSVELAKTLFILVSKSGTTQETLANELFVKDLLKKAGLDPSKHMIAVTSETSPLANNPAISLRSMDDHRSRYFFARRRRRRPRSPSVEPSPPSSTGHAAAIRWNQISAKTRPSTPSSAYERNVLSYPRPPFSPTARPPASRSSRLTWNRTASR